MKLTEFEIHKEMIYRAETRLGELCGGNAPTQEQLNVALREADQWRMDYLRDEDGRRLRAGNERVGHELYLCGEGVE